QRHSFWSGVRAARSVAHDSFSAVWFRAFCWHCFLVPSLSVVVGRCRVGFGGFGSFVLMFSGIGVSHSFALRGSRYLFVPGGLLWRSAALPFVHSKVIFCWAVLK